MVDLTPKVAVLDHLLSGQENKPTLGVHNFPRGIEMTEKVIRAVLRPYPRCYVYIHFDPRKVRPEDKNQIDHVVYVGKGTRERPWVDRRIYSGAHRRWLRDLQYQGFAPDEYVRIEFRKLTEEEALKLEQQLLKFYRDKGVLLFNREKGYKGPVRTYDNKWIPDPAFGKLGRTSRQIDGTQGQNAAMTEDRFKRMVERDESEAGIRYDLRPFEDQQNEATAWYLGNLVFLFSVSSIVPPTKPVTVVVDSRFTLTRQMDGFLKTLTERGLPIEIRRTARNTENLERVLRKR